MGVLDNYRDANGEAIQPYYAAYLILNDFETPEEARRATCPNGSNADYVIWNSRQWQEYDRLHGIAPGTPRVYRKEFQVWLERRCAAVLTDRIARQHVEAA